MKLIINVDDLGLHPAVTRAIDELSSMGMVTSSSVMANGPYVKDAVALNQSVSLGAHLNILRGRPIADLNKVSSIVTSDGVMHGDYTQLFLKYMTGQLKVSEVEYEWDLQIQTLLDLGLTLTHIDSERHIHCWPKLYQIACKLAQKYNIPWVRKPYEKTNRLRLDKGKLRTTVLNTFLSMTNTPSDIETTDTVWGIADQGSLLLPEKFEAFIKTQPKDTVIEMVCHPAKRLPEDPDIDASYGKFRIFEVWKSEYNSLKDPKWKAIFKENQIEVVGFK